MECLGAVLVDVGEPLNSVVVRSAGGALGPPHYQGLCGGHHRISNFDGGFCLRRASIDFLA